MIIRVAEVNQRRTVAVLLASARVARLTYNGCAGEYLQLRRVCRHVRDNIEHVVAPERHAVEACGDILDHLPGVGLRLDIDVEHEARLCRGTALSVGHLLVAALSNPVKLPLIQHIGRHAAPQAKSWLRQDVEPDPRRVIRPAPFECTVPSAVISARQGIVVLRNADYSTFRFAGNLWDITE